MDAEASVEVCIRERYVELVRAVAIACGSVPTAEDAVQEAFARAWEKQRKGERFTHLAGWVVTTALNHTRSRWRRVRRETELRVAPSAPAQDLELALDVRAAVAALPARQRDVVVLYYLLDFDIATTAELLGVSDGTVKTGLSRARTALAEKLGAHEESER